MLDFRTFFPAALLAVSATPSLADDLPLRVVDKIAIGGEARWDYLTVDTAAHRLYVSHGSQVEVVDTSTDKKTGVIENTPGVHGIALAPDLGLGFTSNGRDNSVTVFDLKSLVTKAKIAVGTNPDAIVYAPASHRVVTFNGRSHDATVIDATTLSVVSTIAIGGKPEYAQLGTDGKVYFNVEDWNEIAALDPVSAKITMRHPLSACDGPSGLAVDERLYFYSVCENKMMVVSDSSGKRLAQVAIGGGADGVAWMNGVAYSANGADGTISAVQTGTSKDFTVVATVPTALGARTIAADPSTRRLYMPSAQVMPAEKIGGRPTVIADTFYVLVLEAQ